SPAGELVPAAEVVVDRRLPRRPAAAGVPDVALLLVAGVGLRVGFGHDTPPDRRSDSSNGSSSAPAVPAAAQASTTSQDSGSSGRQPKNRDRTGVWTTTARTASDPAAVASTS